VGRKQGRAWVGKEGKEGRKEKGKKGEKGKGGKRRKKETPAGFAAATAAGRARAPVGDAQRAARNERKKRDGTVIGFGVGTA
jgi:hypothetical protein